ncbi:flavodoxin domain-containing protein [Zhenpiania hominis]|uniref:Flavodoxin domain-containing protein n=1 Tax=Zhenpiania hominis TaxID=2763644 RepID=A0A923NMK7_9FIRM|nr:flavodoxin domain-containing protein [Zhenpiania hominis]MBC6679759.1 hypothetical protein [Zhenpiania hominis]
MKKAVVYISKNGTTRDTVDQIRKRAAESIDYYDLEKSQDIPVSQYDQLYLGCGIYAGTVSKEMRKFMNNGELKNKEVTFFVHGLDSAESHRMILEHSVRDHSWMENCPMYYLGGACDLKKQNFLIRKMLKAIAKKKNLDADHMENLDQQAICDFVSRVCEDR